MLSQEHFICLLIVLALEVTTLWPSVYLIKIMTIAKGLKQLGFTPDVDFVCQNDGDGKGDYIREWLSKSAQPSDSEITTAANTFDTNYTNNKYQRDRVSNGSTKYASIGDQLDMLYKDIVAGKIDSTGTWAKHIKAVKDANPKP